MTDAMKRDSMEATVPDLSTKLESTKLGGPAPTKKHRLGLTDLPPSVRNKIYAHCLDTELVNTGASNVSYTQRISDGVLHFKASRPPFPVQTALFYVNKEISKEALEYFYATNIFVRLEVYADDARHAKTLLTESGLLFSVANPDVVDNVERQAMDVALVEKESKTLRARVLFPAQYLPRLVQFMAMAAQATKTWAPAQTLRLDVKNSYGMDMARLQGDLLEGFRMLTGIGKVEVQGDGVELLPGYANGLQESMMASQFDAGKWLEMVTGIVDSAEEAHKKEDFNIAAQQAQSTIIAMTYGYLTRAETLHSQPEDFTKSIQRLRWRTELTLGKSLSNKHRSVTDTKTWLSDSATPLAQKQTVAKDLLAAETASSAALSLATDSPSPTSNPWFRSLPAELIPPNKADWFTDAERGMSWYVCGMAHLVLGEYLFAAGDLERAERLWPGGEGVAEAFEKAREGIDWSVQPGMGLRMAVKVAKGVVGA